MACSGYHLIQQIIQRKRYAGGVDAGMACIAVAAGGKVSVDYEPYMPVYIKNQTHR